MTPSEKESGLFYPDGSFKSDRQIRYENMDEPVLIRQKAEGRAPSFDEWTEEFVHRRDLREEFESLPDEIELTIETNRPIIIGCIGDIHTGGKELDYELLHHDVEFIKNHPNAYAILGGDLIDGFFFNPAQDQQIASWNEQRMFVRSILDELKGKVLFFIEGDHDMWAGRTGGTIYDQIRDEYGAEIVRGSTRVGLNLPGVKYKMVVAHQLPGHSMYNDVHPEMREAKFGTQGADIYLGFHTHKKAFHKQIVDTFEECKEQLFVSSGPYKYSDDYAKKKGYSKQRRQRRGAVFMVLHPMEKQMDAYNSSEEAATRFLESI